MIPLVKKLDIDEINTSLIAIRKLLNNVGITETNITNIVGKDYDAKIQELEEKVENSKKKWTGSFTFRSNGGNNGTSFTVNEVVPKGRYLYTLKTGLGGTSRINLGINTVQDINTYRLTLLSTTEGDSKVTATGIVEIENPTDTFYQYGYQHNGSEYRTVDVEIVPLSL